MITYAAISSVIGRPKGEQSVCWLSLAFPGILQILNNCLHTGMDNWLVRPPDRFALISSDTCDFNELLCNGIFRYS